MHKKKLSRVVNKQQEAIGRIRKYQEMSESSRRYQEASRKPQEASGRCNIKIIIIIIIKNTVALKPQVDSKNITVKKHCHLKTLLIRG